jgi:hypothetical protein
MLTLVMALSIIRDTVVPSRQLPEGFAIHMDNTLDVSVDTRSRFTETRSLEQP